LKYHPSKFLTSCIDVLVGDGSLWPLIGSKTWHGFRLSGNPYIGPNEIIGFQKSAFMKVLNYQLR
jgi:hypothetical protein